MKEIAWQNNTKQREHQPLCVNRQKMRSGLLLTYYTANAAIKTVVISSIGWRLSSEYWLAERHSCAELPDHREIVIRPSLL